MTPRRDLLPHLSRCSPSCRDDLPAITRQAEPTPRWATMIATQPKRSHTSVTHSTHCCGHGARPATRRRCRSEPLRGALISEPPGENVDPGRAVYRNHASDLAQAAFGGVPKSARSRSQPTEPTISYQQSEIFRQVPNIRAIVGCRRLWGQGLGARSSSTGRLPEPDGIG